MRAAMQVEPRQRCKEIRLSALLRLWFDRAAGKQAELRLEQQRLHDSIAALEAELREQILFLSTRFWLVLTLQL